ncbi:MAG: type II toxin-antitoxin system VapC family toxin [Candidatus Acidiferrum sp.]
MILLDTHVVVWSFSEPQRISVAARNAITQGRRGGATLAISAVTLVELSILARKRRIETGDNLAAYLKDVESTFVVLPIVAAVCLQLPNLPESYPRDPVDQVVGATAMAEGIPLVTADEKIRKAKAFETIW